MTHPSHPTPADHPAHADHPARQEWPPFLAGEAAPEASRRLAEHLEHCSECSAEIAAWRRAEKRLGQWKLPRAQQRPGALRKGLRRAFWLATAAALPLAAGICLDRWLAAGPAAGEARLAKIAEEIRRDLTAQVTSRLDLGESRFSSQLKEMESRLAHASETGGRQLVEALSVILGHAREEDRRGVLAMLRDLEERHASTYAAMRKELETFASLTYEEFRNAQARFALLTPSGKRTEDN